MRSVKKDSEGEGGNGNRDSAADDELSIIDGEEVSGVVLSNLLSRRPELQRELSILRQTLLLEEAGGGASGGSGGGSEELKVRCPGVLTFVCLVMASVPTLIAIRREYECYS